MTSELKKSKKFRGQQTGVPEKKKKTNWRDHIHQTTVNP